MLNLLAQDSTQDFGMMDVLLWPVLLTALGIGIFFFGLWLERKGKRAPWKWAAVVPVLVGAYVGYPYASILYSDPELYKAQHLAFGEKKLYASHYGALFIPILGLIGLVLLHFFNHKIKLTPED